MSEYQYYEFQAVDRPLTRDEMRELRAVSSRAEITATRFVNEYEWGDFKGDAFEWMERYFDAFLYLANWGTRELMLRLPRQALDTAAAGRYCRGDVASVEESGEFVILQLTSHQDGGDEWFEQGPGYLASILPVRAEIASGDFRALYLAWLLWAERGEDTDEDSPEPPVPPGLGTPTAAQQAFADFLRIDPDLIRAAAERSPNARPDPDPAALRGWMGALPQGEAADLLVRVARGEAVSVRAELLRRFRDAQDGDGGAQAEPRTVAELLEAAERVAAERVRAEKEEAARERARRERAEAAARERRLRGLAERQEESWGRVDELAAQKTAGAYEEAVRLLLDLRELAVRDGRRDEVDARTAALRERHGGKRRFIERVDQAIRGELPSAAVPAAQLDLPSA
jgi:hypothetical protein